MVLPETKAGRISRVDPKIGTVTTFASGLPKQLAVFGIGRVVKVNDDGTFTTIVEGLNQPTSMEFIGNTAYVVTLNGEIYRIDNVSPPPYGVEH
jgi:hypothetical protein